MINQTTAQSRRDFLRSATLLTTAAVAAPFIWTGTSARGEEAKNDKLNIACIGVGARGSGIGHAAGAIGNMGACCDVD